MEWDKVKATCPDMSITGTFGELAWPLKFLGVDAARLGALGKGESEPVASNDSPNGRAKNRRIEFRAKK